MRLAILTNLFLLTFTVLAFAQKADLKKGNQFFKEDKYAKAIPHYLKALKVKNNLSIKSKLALCYKITNQMEEAGKLYEEIVQHDRAKTKTFYYYAETLMSQGKYDLAKKWFKKYATIETEDELVQQRIASCDFAKTIQPHFGFASVKAFPQNSEEDDNAPVFWDEGIVFTSDRRGKLKFLDTKSGATDRNYLRLYYSKELTDGSYSKPSEFISKFNDARKNTGMASFTANKKAMYFTRNGIHLNKKNAYCLQLFEAKSDDGKHWKKTEVLPFCQKQSNYMHPAISPDGKILFFVSDKPGGVGGTDIYMSRKTKKRWTKPKNLGPNVNTEGHEGFPFMHQNGKLYFCSKGHMGLGGYDIFVTQMNEEGEWTKPINLGAPINSPADDISIFISADSTKGLFTSARAGGDDDVFLVSFIEEEIRNDSSEGLDKVITKDEIPKEMEYVPQSVLIESPLDKIKKQAGQSQANPQKTKIGKIEEKTDFLQVIEWRASAIQSGMLFSLPTVQFSEGLDSLEPKTKLELDKVLAILEKNPKLIIEIAAHVANLGDFEQKIKLTQKQAIAISTYLENKGIDRKRLLPKGYGGQQPLNKCLLDIDCTVEEHAINNRVEIKVLAN